MWRGLVIGLFLSLVAGVGAQDDAYWKRQKAEFLKLEGQWKRAVGKDDPKQITLEFFKKTPGRIDTYWLRIRADWTEQGKAKKFEAIKACRFSKNDKELYFELTGSPVSAESGHWANYRMAGDKLELHKIPQIAGELGIDLSGNYQRSKAEKKGVDKGETPNNPLQPTGPV